MSPTSCDPAPAFLAPHNFPTTIEKTSFARGMQGRGVPPSSVSTQRVVPVESSEAREVRVGGDDGHPVFEGEGGERGVGDEVPAEVVRGDELAQDARVVRTGLRDPGDGRLEPGSDLAPCGLTIERSPGRSRMRHDPQECAEGLPRKADAVWPVELLGEPRHGLLVALGASVDGVDQEVGVKEHYATAGPSSVSSASATLSMLMCTPRS